MFKHSAETRGDCGLLSPDLAAGIRRVKGAKKHGVRLGNWLTAGQGKRLLSVFDRDSLRGKRDYAIVAVLLDYQYGIDESSPNRFYTTTSDLRLSELPDGPVVIAADVALQPFPPNILFL